MTGRFAPLVPRCLISGLAIAIALTPHGVAAQASPATSTQSLEQAAARDSLNHAAWMRLAGAYHQAEQYPEAMVALDRAVRLAPKNHAVRFNRALTLSEVGRIGEAAAELDTAITLRQDFAPSFTERGAARALVGRVREAQADWATSLRLDSSYVWARFYRGLAAVASGDFAGAATDLDAVTSSQSLLSAHLWRWIAYARAGRVPPALPASDTQWPGPIAAFLEGRLSDTALVARAHEARLRIDDRRLASALFFIAEKHLIDGRVAEARETFARVLSTPAPRHAEVVAAAAHLAVLRGDTIRDDIHPAVSPDGSSVAFSSNRTGTHQIYVLHRPTGEVRQITLGPVPKYWPSWSPDATRLVFDSDRSGNQELFVVDLAAGTEQRLTTDPAFDAVSAWAPRNNLIAFDSNRRPDGAADIWVARPDGSDQRALWSDSTSDGHPSWSPDARFIAYKTGPLRGSSPRPSEIAIVELSTGMRRVLTRNGGVNVSPSWSPDGARLYFTSRRGGDAEIYSIRADGTDERRVTRGGGDKQRPTVSPDGHSLIYAARQSRTWSLWHLDLRSGARRPLMK
jgi:Tol biopolymer transport system component/tetratricopeptide (TPR) repeat protein